MGFVVEHRLAGWELAWARLEVVADAQEAAARARVRYAEQARRTWRLEGLAQDAVVAGVRALFRAAGVDPTRYRPSSEALLRRVLKGEDLPAIHPLVDLNNCLSVALAVPSCVMAAGSLAPPVVLRRGEPGERYESLRGELDLSGKPLLADARGPFGTPITDAARVRVETEAREGVLVAYLPAGLVGVSSVDDVLAGLDGVARVRERFDSRS
jgi:DNA/RNA-binding domain of Phe-tRNA-synthetase-like protein